MADRWKFIYAVGVLLVCTFTLFGQVLPVPIPGGDIIPPTLSLTSFFPGVGSGFDGMNADPRRRSVSTSDTTLEKQKPR